MPQQIYRHNFRISHQFDIINTRIQGIQINILNHYLDAALIHGGVPGDEVYVVVGEEGFAVDAPHDP